MYACVWGSPRLQVCSINILFLSVSYNYSQNVRKLYNVVGVHRGANVKYNNHNNNNIIIRYYLHRNIVQVTGVYYYIIYMTCPTQRFWHINKGAKLYYFTRAHTHNIIFKNIHTDILTYL